MGRPDVDRMLSELTSYQLSEWMAYEKHHGPLDHTWDQKATAHQDEILQQILDVLIKTAGGKGRKVQDLAMPWDNNPYSGSSKPVVPVKSKEKLVEERNQFDTTLEERNRRRGYVIDSGNIAEVIAEAEAKKAKKNDRNNKA